MATAARDRLARTLRGDAQTAFSVELTARTDDLSLEVEGFGHVRFPVTPAKARKLLGLGQPARFGRGEETLTDPDVRDTWEIPKHLVRAEWNDAALKVILATVKEELGLPNAAELTADLHSLLVYETNQHFLAHQDSEKDDSMVGTLVVTLPSSYAGGELMVGHNEEWKAYRGSKTALSLVAFYADCRHEVLRVTVGLPDHAHLQPAPARRHQPSGGRRRNRRRTGGPPPRALQHAGAPLLRRTRGRPAEPARLPPRPRVHAPRAELAAAEGRGREPGGPAAGRRGQSRLRGRPRARRHQDDAQRVPGR